MYENASSSVQINGYIAGPIPIHCSKRQGCPMSMTVFAMCIDPLLRMLEQNLFGIQIGKRARRRVLLAYADDVTIFVTTPANLHIIQETTVLRKNNRGTPKHEEIENLINGRMESHQQRSGHKILDVTFTRTIEQSKNKSSANVTCRVRAQVRDTYG
jgi:hypothetical protein